MLRSRDIALTALIAGAYATLVIGLIQFSFALVQVRVADALIPLSIIFGWPAILGVTIGCVVANAFTPMPLAIVEVTLGPLANLLASYAAFRISKLSLNAKYLDFLACFVATLIVTFIVGTYLALITEMPLWIWWMSLFIGSFISINVLGLALVKLLRRYGFVEKRR
ncbi:MAG: hypothetical protein DRJ31_02140 [Candidatus Methanomethylicota archaeon]|uniref:QueT transporter family protein n=1 Tax=Thermoproteota archaeon TaxID=2056631 RepID=A0A497EZS8_9CREN|nr:MAG: hypothetical protein DRJ31_02140 [Candidatus Verstraetearchaeota archaeon]RLE52903.1 MAG: hypothetical protein DRJ33_02500 [Candidatus Verstraetearchaeota archaeon]